MIKLMQGVCKAWTTSTQLTSMGQTFLFFFFPPLSLAASASVPLPTFLRAKADHLFFKVAKNVPTALFHPCCIFIPLSLPLITLSNQGALSCHKLYTSSSKNEKGEKNPQT
jgi:hypothetical protein